MKIRKLRYWTLVVMGTVVALFFPSDDVFARGGGGRGGGGGGGGGRGGGGGGGGRGGGMGGSAGRAAAAAAARGGGRGGRNNDRKDQEEIDRREERMARVAEARILYAKRERRTMWNEESKSRFGLLIRRVLEGTSE